MRKICHKDKKGSSDKKERGCEKTRNKVAGQQVRGLVQYSLLSFDLFSPILKPTGIQNTSIIRC